MDLPVAIGMEQNPILGGIFPSVHTPHNMVVVPPCELGDLLLTDWTESFLLFPEGDQLPFPLEIVYHLDAEAFFKVLFPSGIVGVCFSLDFHMSFDRDICRVKEIIFYEAFFGYDGSVEDQFFPLTDLKYRSFTHCLDLLGCLLFVHRHRAQKMAWPTLAKVTLLTTCW